MVEHINPLKEFISLKYKITVSEAITPFLIRIFNTLVNLFNYCTKNNIKSSVGFQQNISSETVFLLYPYSNILPSSFIYLLLGTEEKRLQFYVYNISNDQLEANYDFMNICNIIESRQLRIILPGNPFYINDPLEKSCCSVDISESRKFIIQKFHLLTDGVGHTLPLPPTPTPCEPSDPQAKKRKFNIKRELEDIKTSNQNIFNFLEQIQISQKLLLGNQSRLIKSLTTFTESLKK